MNLGMVIAFRTNAVLKEYASQFVIPMLNADQTKFATIVFVKSVVEVIQLVNPKKHA